MEYQNEFDSKIQDGAKLKVLFLVGPKMEEVPKMLAKGELEIPLQRLGCLETDGKTKSEIIKYIHAKCDKDTVFFLSMHGDVRNEQDKIIHTIGTGIIDDSQEPSRPLEETSDLLNIIEEAMPGVPHKIEVDSCFGGAIKHALPNLKFKPGVKTEITTLTNQHEVRFKYIDYTTKVLEILIQEIQKLPGQSLSGADFLELYKLFVGIQRTKTYTAEGNEKPLGKPKKMDLKMQYVLDKLIRAAVYPDYAKRWFTEEVLVGLGVPNRLPFLNIIPKCCNSLTNIYKDTGQTYEQLYARALLYYVVSSKSSFAKLKIAEHKYVRDTTLVNYVVNSLLPHHIDMWKFFSHPFSHAGRFSLNTLVNRAISSKKDSNDYVQAGLEFLKLSHVDIDTSNEDGDSLMLEDLRYPLDPQDFVNALELWLRLGANPNYVNLKSKNISTYFYSLFKVNSVPKNIVSIALSKKFDASFSIMLLFRGINGKNPAILGQDTIDFLVSNFATLMKESTENLVALSCVPRFGDFKLHEGFQREIEKLNNVPIYYGIRFLSAVMYGQDNLMKQLIDDLGDGKEEMRSIVNVLSSNSIPIDVLPRLSQVPGLSGSAYASIINSVTKSEIEADAKLKLIGELLENIKGELSKNTAKYDSFTLFLSSPLPFKILQNLLAIPDLSGVAYVHIISLATQSSIGMDNMQELIKFVLAKLDKDEKKFNDFVFFSNTPLPAELIEVLLKNDKLSVLAYANILNNVAIPKLTKEEEKIKLYRSVLENIKLRLQGNKEKYLEFISHLNVGIPLELWLEFAQEGDLSAEAAANIFNQLAATPMKREERRQILEKALKNFKAKLSGSPEKYNVFIWQLDKQIPAQLWPDLLNDSDLSEKAYANILTRVAAAEISAEEKQNLLKILMDKIKAKLKGSVEKYDNLVQYLGYGTTPQLLRDLSHDDKLSGKAYANILNQGASTNLKQKEKRELCEELLKNIVDNLKLNPAKSPGFINLLNNQIIADSLPILLTLPGLSGKEYASLINQADEVSTEGVEKQQLLEGMVKNIQAILIRFPEQYESFAQFLNIEYAWQLLINLSQIDNLSGKAYANIVNLAFASKIKRKEKQILLEQVLKNVRTKLNIKAEKYIDFVDALWLPIPTELLFELSQKDKLSGKAFVNIINSVGESKLPETEKKELLKNIQKNLLTTLQTASLSGGDYAHLINEVKSLNIGEAKKTELLEGLLKSIQPKLVEIIQKVDDFICYLKSPIPAIVLETLSQTAGLSVEAYVNIINNAVESKIDQVLLGQMLSNIQKNLLTTLQTGSLSGGDYAHLINEVKSLNIGEAKKTELLEGLLKSIQPKLVEIIQKGDDFICYLKSPIPAIVLETLSQTAGLSVEAYVNIINKAVESKIDQVLLGQMLSNIQKNLLTTLQTGSLSGGDYAHLINEVKSLNIGEAKKTELLEGLLKSIQPKLVEIIQKVDDFIWYLKSPIPAIVLETLSQTAGLSVKAYVNIINKAVESKIDQVLLGQMLSNIQKNLLTTLQTGSLSGGDYAHLINEVKSLNIGEAKKTELLEGLLKSIQPKLVEIIQKGDDFICYLKSPIPAIVLETLSQTAGLSVKAYVNIINNAVESKIDQVLLGQMLSNIQKNLLTTLQTGSLSGGGYAHLINGVKSLNIPEVNKLGLYERLLKNIHEHLQVDEEEYSSFVFSLSDPVSPAVLQFLSHIPGFTEKTYARIKDKIKVSNLDQPGKNIMLSSINQLDIDTIQYGNQKLSLNTLGPIDIRADVMSRYVMEGEPYAHILNYAIKLKKSDAEILVLFKRIKVKLEQRPGIYPIFIGLLADPVPNQILQALLQGPDLSGDSYVSILKKVAASNMTPGEKLEATKNIQAKLEKDVKKYQDFIDTLDVSVAADLFPVLSPIDGLSGWQYAKIINLAVEAHVPSEVLGALLENIQKRIQKSAKIHENFTSQLNGKALVPPEILLRLSQTPGLSAYSYANIVNKSFSSAIAANTLLDMIENIRKNLLAKEYKLFIDKLKLSDPISKEILQYLSRTPGLSDEIYAKIIELAEKSELNKPEIMQLQTNIRESSAQEVKKQEESKTEFKFVKDVLQQPPGSSKKAEASAEPQTGETIQNIF